MNTTSKKLLISASFTILTSSLGILHAQDSQSYPVQVSEEVLEASVAVTDSAVKTGVVMSAVPVSAASVGTAVVGSATASIADTSLEISSGLSQATADSIEFANTPLIVDNDVITLPKADAAPDLSKKKDDDKKN